MNTSSGYLTFISSIRILLAPQNIRQVTALLIYVSLIFLSNNQAQAQVIGQYNFTGVKSADTSVSPVAAATAANVSLTPITRGPGLSSTGASDRFNSSDFGDFTTTPSNSKFNSDDYFTFTITPSQGYKLNLTSFQTAYQRSSTGPSQYDIRTNIDNYTASVQTGSLGTLGTANNNTLTINFNSAPYTSGTITAPLVVRFYAYSASGTAGTLSLGSTSQNPNALIVNGSLAVTPAPPGVVSAGIGFGVTGFSALLRRRKQSKATKIAAATD